ncbi:HNH endonuclease signature motif containing protein, partial [Mycolicibacterium stellerae]|uniref:HNH endonuclease signature motif containing protein n=1 Tax=Mycolicibacterium stellerae TaxID=2358193 RepID=UPI0013DE1072
FARRTGLPAGQRELWWVDAQASAVAEMAAAVNVSHAMALHQTHRGVALRDRLPQVGALFEQGLISDLLVRTIVWRTYLIDDAEAMTKVDGALAERITRWGGLSIAKTQDAIDALVDEHDPGALRRSRQSQSDPPVEFGSPADVAGTTSMWARLHSANAALIEHSVEELARSVCEADPRSINHRRADALTAAVTHTAMVCGCGQPDCGGPAGDRPAKNAIVYAVADQKSVDVATTAQTPAEAETAAPAGPVNAADEPGGDAPESAHNGHDVTAAPAACSAPPAYVFGAGILPTALLGAIVERATIRPVRHPGDSTAPESRYTPSRQMGEFVRCRDLTCRFPGCDKPAQFCDIDHTVAYPVGPTHPSNLKCLCRFHHLLKTFWNGPKGWRDRQLPDGTVIWTAPTGHTYTTYPGSRHLFPQLCAPTATLWTGQPPEVEPAQGRGAMMPKRRHTRAHTTAKAKAA